MKKKMRRSEKIIFKTPHKKSRFCILFALRREFRKLRSKTKKRQEEVRK